MSNTASLKVKLMQLYFNYKDCYITFKELLVIILWTILLLK